MKILFLFIIFCFLITQVSFAQDCKTQAANKASTYDAKRRKWFDEDQQKLQNQINKIKPNVDASREILNQYLQKPSDWLGRGIGFFYSSFYTANGIKSYLDHLDTYSESKEDYTRSEVVYINPAYFNKTLGMDVPQVIVVTVNKGGYPYMHKLAGLVKQPGALTPLEAILNPGKF